VGLIDGMRRKGRTVLLTTHYLEEAGTLCDRVAIMDHGKILEPARSRAREPPVRERGVTSTR
jgi:ABC-2 type transport system ATP-binding protein